MSWEITSFRIKTNRSDSITVECLNFRHMTSTKTIDIHLSPLALSLCPFCLLKQFYNCFGFISFLLQTSWKIIRNKRKGKRTKKKKQKKFSRWLDRLSNCRRLLQLLASLVADYRHIRTTWQSHWKRMMNMRHCAILANTSAAPNHFNRSTCNMFSIAHAHNHKRNAILASY